MSCMDLPDAPWIREAETYGMPEPEDVNYYCPVCGAEQPEDFYFDRDGDICGCCDCMKRRDAYEYVIEHREMIA